MRSSIRKSEILQSLASIGKIRQTYTPPEQAVIAVELDGVVDVLGRKFAVRIVREDRRLSLYDIALLKAARDADKSLVGGVIVADDARPRDVRMAKMLGQSVLLTSALHLANDTG